MAVVGAAIGLSVLLLVVAMVGGTATPDDADDAFILPADATTQGIGIVNHGPRATPPSSESLPSGAAPTSTTAPDVRLARGVPHAEIQF
jgi:hypothetical protein